MVPITDSSIRLHFNKVLSRIAQFRKLKRTDEYITLIDIRIYGCNKK